MDSDQIEVEFRAIFDKVKFEQLKTYLDKNATDQGQDDKNVFFYVYSDKFVKVVDNVSQKTAKLVLKLTKIGRGTNFDETEIPIDPAYIPKAVKFFSHLCPNPVMESFQQRRNYLLKGVEVSLKYSQNWGYHLELEVVINHLSQKTAAVKKIKNIAQELDVKLMTETEIRQFIKKFEKGFK